MKDYKDFFLLRGLSEEVREEIISSFDDTCIFSRGELIYSEDKFFDAIGYIIKGSAVAQTNNGSCIVMKKFKSGMSFGAAALFGNDRAYISKIMAQEECVIQFIDEKKLKQIFLDYPITAINYISFLSDKVRFLNRKLSIISCATADDTVFKYLVDSADSAGRVLLPNNMSLLAKTLGVGRTSLYRSLEALESKGRIIREKNIIRVKKL